MDFPKRLQQDKAGRRGSRFGVVLFDFFPLSSRELDTFRTRDSGITH